MFNSFKFLIINRYKDMIKYKDDFGLNITSLAFAKYKQLKDLEMADEEGEKNNLKIIDLLLDKRIGLLSSDKTNCTTLHYAILTSNYMFVERMIKERLRIVRYNNKLTAIDINLTNYMGENSLVLAIKLKESYEKENRNIDIEKQIEMSRDKNKDFMEELTEYNEYLKNIEAYNKEEKEYKCPPKNWRSNKHTKCEKAKGQIKALYLKDSKKKIIDLLLEKKCDIYKKDNLENTIFHHIVLCCSYDIMKHTFDKIFEIVKARRKMYRRRSAETLEKLDKAERDHKLKTLYLDVNKNGLNILSTAIVSPFDNQVKILKVVEFLQDKFNVNKTILENFVNENGIDRLIETTKYSLCTDKEFYDEIYNISNNNEELNKLKEKYEENTKMWSVRKVTSGRWKYKQSKNRLDIINKYQEINKLQNDFITDKDNKDNNEDRACNKDNNEDKNEDKNEDNIKRENYEKNSLIGKIFDRLDDIDQITPLMLAIQNGSIETIKMLLYIAQLKKINIDYSKKDVHGRNTIMYAVSSNSYPIFKLFTGTETTNLKDY